MSSSLKIYAIAMYSSPLEICHYVATFIYLDNLSLENTNLWSVKAKLQPIQEGAESECCHLSFSLHKTLFDQYFDTAIL